MAEKRKFYNCEEQGTKGMSKRTFFEEVLKMATGEEVTDDMADFIARAAEYELEGINNRPSKAGAEGPAKDPLQSDYAVALREAIVPLVNGNPQTAKQLVDAATAKGKLAPSGKSFSAPWTSRVLNAMAKEGKGIAEVKMVVETVDAKGLKKQREVSGYKRV